MEDREKPRVENTRRLQMTGIMMPVVCLHHIWFGTSENVTHLNLVALSVPL
jgi:hypothetical protein